MTSNVFRKNISILESQVQRLQKADMKNAELIERLDHYIE